MEKTSIGSISRKYMQDKYPAILAYPGIDVVLNDETFAAFDVVSVALGYTPEDVVDMLIARLLVGDAAGAAELTALTICAFYDMQEQIEKFGATLVA